jgi:hypothetical protein
LVVWQDASRDINSSEERFNQVEVGGKKTEVYQAYRITVFGGPFAVRAMALLLAIDDKITLVGIEGRQLDRVNFILYDGSLLREGATFTVGYGAGRYCQVKMRKVSSGSSCGILHGCVPLSLPAIVIASPLRSSAIAFGYIFGSP